MYSKEFPELKNYDFLVEGMCEAENETVKVNEVTICIKAAEGDRKPAGAAGIRVGNVKYMFVVYDEIT